MSQIPQHKAYYIGYMIRKLLMVYPNKLPYDDRDSYANDVLIHQYLVGRSI